MKQLLLVFLLISLQTWGQTKPYVPLIKDGPKPRVPLLDEPQESDLLDITFKGERPKLPNAGKKVFDVIGMNSTFTFNKKIGFLVKSSEGVYSSYFYLNTQNGYAMMDHQALKVMHPEATEGKLTQIFTPASEFYQYIQSSEGNFVMKMGSNINGPAMQHLVGEMNAKAFFTDFKKTGNKNKGRNFKSVEYVGKDEEGQPLSVYLSDPQDVLIDIGYTYELVGFFGLGYLASPSKRTYLVTGLQGQGATIAMTAIGNVNVSFAGKGYQPMGNLMAQAMSGNPARMQQDARRMKQEANTEIDAARRAYLQKQAQEAEKMGKHMQKSSDKFAQTSDIRDLPSVQAANSEEVIRSTYDLMIAGLDESIRQSELTIAEARKNADAEGVKRATCLRSCAMQEKARQQRMKEEHLAIAKKYPSDDDKRESELNRFYERNGTIKGCNCQ